jgi:hypothetical protein
MTLDESQNSLFLGNEFSILTGKAYENFEAFMINYLNSHQAIWVH